MRFLLPVLPWLALAAFSPAREVASSMPRPGQKAVNDTVNARLTALRDDAVRESWRKTPGDTEKALVAVWKATVFPLTKKSIASVERALERDAAIAPELNYGDLPKAERADNGVFAPSILLTSGGTDLCVGLDKFGHFFEEGFLCRQIVLATPNGGERIADGVSRWLEGLEPDVATVAWIYRTRTFKAWWVDEAGKRDYDLVGSFGAHAASKGVMENRSSPADIAANKAGMRWYAALEALLKGAPRDITGLEKLLKDNPVRVEEFVTEDWDESRNPNVRTLEKAPQPDGK